MQTALAGEPDIDIVIIGVVLPGSVHGVALAQEVAVRALPVILTSGDHTRIEEMEKSGHYYIVKPYRMSSLLEVIDNTLKATKARCERKGTATFSGSERYEF